jgi:hypothetical protein
LSIHIRYERTKGFVNAFPHAEVGEELDRFLASVIDRTKKPTFDFVGAETSELYCVKIILAETTSRPPIKERTSPILLTPRADYSLGSHIKVRKAILSFR